MVEVTVLRSLADVVRCCPQPELHPAFRVFWGEAGVVARIKYVAKHPETPLREDVEAEVTDCERSMSESNNKAAWGEIAQACAAYRLLERTRR